MWIISHRASVRINSLLQQHVTVPRVAEIRSLLSCLTLATSHWSARALHERSPEFNALARPTPHDDQGEDSTPVHVPIFLLLGRLTPWAHVENDAANGGRPRMPLVAVAPLPRRPNPIRLPPTRSHHLPSHAHGPQQITRDTRRHGAHTCRVARPRESRVRLDGPLAARPAHGCSPRAPAARARPCASRAPAPPNHGRVRRPPGRQR